MERAAARLEQRLFGRRPLSARDGVFYLIDGADTAPATLANASLTVVRGDQQETAIAAASVIASVAHEAAMIALSRRWPLWDFEVNSGWPSRQHLRLQFRDGPLRPLRSIDEFAAVSPGHTRVIVLPPPLARLLAATMSSRLCESFASIAPAGAASPCAASSND